MKLDHETQDLINQLYDEAVLAHGKDHIAAASQALDDLRSLEAGGHAWATVVLDACVLDGLTKRIKVRAKRSLISVPSKTGAKATMPGRYSRQRADGSRQLELWVDLPLDELRDVLRGLQRQAGVLNQRASRMQLGIDLAEKHGVNTAREGFAAEGIQIEEAVSSWLAR